MTTLPDLSQYQFSAIVFDCDGTLVDSAALHYEAFRSGLLDQGLDMNRTWYMERTGLSRHALIAAHAEEFGSQIDVPAVVARSEDWFAENVHRMTEVAEIAGLARKYAGKVPIAVASGGQRVHVEGSLTATGLIGLFDAIVTLEDVGVGKPDPAVFLKAAELLGVPPRECLAFDDTDEGVEAATRAGMTTIDVRQLADWSSAAPTGGATMRSSD
ncbi:HAD family hydrolase [Rhizobium mongolense]|uniref:Beta-phosphoglucomutase-like phosphatase (HAD superfamily) n=2 Tax=Rhizobium mongolense TaxID=57676 RepID=A0ABR6IJL8_9HYPH|nr:HAD family phosphatase [Rhizobium mongolense]MBB4227995.1 beta-phosphoglucomutase-like phosphatase (HAD superfamily) [Rhizobium mongolense]TVZ64853.1 HAD superfamily hydrolase (TIGR01509 family) [Rhizobium mongolense USDA 1844]